GGGAVARRRGDRAVGAGGEAGSRVLVQEDGTAIGVLAAGERVGELGVAGGDHRAAVLVEGVGEVVAESAVLAGGRAGGAALADAAAVHHPVGGPGAGDGRGGMVGVDWDGVGVLHGRPAAA